MSPPDVALATTSSVEDPDLPALLAALASRGAHAVGVAWDDPDFDFSAPAITVIRSTWDYAGRHEAFLRWARAVGSLCNPFEVVAWNSDKHYLGDLAGAGVPVVETTYATSGEAAQLPDGDVVVKPVVGGGSRGVSRFSARDADAARRHVDALASRVGAAMVQPYVPAAERGEVDVVVLAGEVSHAVRKHAPIGLDPDAAPQGPTSVEPVVVSREHLEVVDRALAAVPGGPDLCYARVDLLEAPEGPLVVELELIEPFLFLGTCEHAASRLAASILSHRDRLGATV